MGATGVRLVILTKFPWPVHLCDACRVLGVAAFGLARVIAPLSGKQAGAAPGTVVNAGWHGQSLCARDGASVVLLGRMVKKPEAVYDAIEAAGETKFSSR